jgi:hypothetical protein
VIGLPLSHSLFSKHAVEGSYPIAGSISCRSIPLPGGVMVAQTTLTRFV